MSSFLGHSLVACSLFSLDHWKQLSARWRVMWLGWLVVIASAPDVDYLFPALGTHIHHGNRITHSVAFSLILPLLTVGLLYCVKVLKGQRRLLSICAVLAGLSHLVLDFLVGVTPLPLLWPLSSATFSSPVGILPSAGRIQLTNYYLYRNVLIEIGVLAPLCYVARAVYLGESGRWSRARMLILLAVAGFFAVWSIGLSR